jgi:SAM-dependent methyltransferase
MGRRAQGLLEASASPRLHLGCAHTILPGWVNIDLFGRVPTDAALDVTKPLPLADASVEAIFTEHMVEHLTYKESLALMCECARVLRPGGVIRIVVPDFERYVRSYMDGDDFIKTVRAGVATPLLGLATIAYGYSHRSIWDAETLTSLLRHVGLVGGKSRFGESRIKPCPDTKARELGSLYVEAVKI